LPCPRIRRRRKRIGRRIARFYGQLVELTPSPVIEVNCAMAVSMAFGAAAGLEIVDPLNHDPALAAYHVSSVRASICCSNWAV
jgi:RNA polymerase sigma-70 factor, ECF subfamily